MPRLSDLTAKAIATWAEQVDKESIAGQPFWIHDMRVSEYDDDQDGESRRVSILVCDITFEGNSRRDPRAVITLGNTPERTPFLEYFQSNSEHARYNPAGFVEPLGPCITYKVPMKGGRSFWRLEDAPETPDELPEMPLKSRGK